MDLKFVCSVLSNITWAEIILCIFYRLVWASSTYQTHALENSFTTSLNVMEVLKKLCKRLSATRPHRIPLVPQKCHTCHLHLPTLYLLPHHHPASPHAIPSVGLELHLLLLLHAQTTMLHLLLLQSLLHRHHLHILGVTCLRLLAKSLQVGLVIFMTWVMQEWRTLNGSLWLDFYF